MQGFAEGADPPGLQGAPQVPVIQQGQAAAAVVALAVVAGQALVADAHAGGDAAQDAAGEGVEHLVGVVRVPTAELVAGGQAGELAGFDGGAGGAVFVAVGQGAEVAFRVLKETDLAGADAGGHHGGFLELAQLVEAGDGGVEPGHATGLGPAFGNLEVEDVGGRHAQDLVHLAAGGEAHLAGVQAVDVVGHRAAVIVVFHAQGDAGAGRGLDLEIVGQALGFDEFQGQGDAAAAEGCAM